MGIQKFLKPCYFATIFIDRNKLHGVNFSMEIHSVSPGNKDALVLKHIREKDDPEKNCSRIDNFRKILEEKGYIDYDLNGNQFPEGISTSRRSNGQVIFERVKSRHAREQIKLNANEERRKDNVPDRKSSGRMGKYSSKSRGSTIRVPETILHMREISDGTSRKSLSKIPIKSGLANPSRTKTSSSKGKIEL